MNHNEIKSRNDLLNALLNNTKRLEEELNNIDKINNKTLRKRRLIKLKNYIKLIHPILIIILMTTAVSTYTDDNPFSLESEKKYLTRLDRVSSNNLCETEYSYSTVEPEGTYLMRYEDFVYDNVQQLYTRRVTKAELGESYIDQVSFMEGKINYDDIVKYSSTTYLEYEKDPDKIVPGYMEAYIYSKDTSRYLYVKENDSDNAKDIFKYLFSIFALIGAYGYIFRGAIFKDIIELKNLSTNYPTLSKEDVLKRLNISNKNIERVNDERVKSK